MACLNYFRVLFGCFAAALGLAGAKVYAQIDPDPTSGASIIDVQWPIKDAFQVPLPGDGSYIGCVNVKVNPLFARAADGAELYIETWAFANNRPDTVAIVVPYGHACNGMLAMAKQYGEQTDVFVEDYFRVGMTFDLPVDWATSYEVWTARIGELPHRTGSVLIEQNGVEHWHLSPKYIYPNAQNNIATILHKAPAKIEPGFTRYIRVTPGW